MKFLKPIDSTNSFDLLFLYQDKNLITLYLIRKQSACSCMLKEQIDTNGVNEDDPNFNRKLDHIAEGARPFVKEHLLTRITKENCLIIIAYILALQVEVNPSERYRLDTIYKLKQLLWRI